VIALIPLFIAASLPGSVNRPEFIVIDVRTRAVIDRQWSDIDTPIPLGSLVKPFTALAYPRDFPEIECRGAASGCWLARGHGKLHFREALAQSCNAYFLNLARGVDAETLRVVALKFGIDVPRGDRAESRIGLGDGWRISPVALLRAYAELAARSSEPRVNEILRGFELAARSGTAHAIGAGAFAKTGTAPCLEDRTHAGDGFTIVMEPAESPRVAILVRLHGTTGAEAAKFAAKIAKGFE